MSTTLDYYNTNAADFISKTINAKFTGVQDRFLNYIPEGGRILDFGCGSGRDTKYFMDKGYSVDAIDGSTELCKSASEYTGTVVRQMLFDELDAVEMYDGIWACASILHLPKDELKGVIPKMITAVKKGGYIYSSFKYGDYEGDRNGRYFTFFTEDTFIPFLSKITTTLKVIETWSSADARPDRSDEKWFNVILQKM